MFEWFENKTVVSSGVSLDKLSVLIASSSMFIFLSKKKIWNILCTKIILIKSCPTLSHWRNGTHKYYINDKWFLHVNVKNVFTFCKYSSASVKSEHWQNERIVNIPMQVTNDCEKDFMMRDVVYGRLSWSRCVVADFVSGKRRILYISNYVRGLSKIHEEFCLNSLTCRCSRLGYHCIS